jgi:hypothetical protein
MSDYIALTLDDIRAMKQASRFSVRIDNDGAHVRLTKELPVRKTGPFCGGGERQEVGREFNANIWSTTCGRFYASHCDGAWRALSLLARPGDMLLFEMRVNNNGYVDKAHLFHDELLVTLLRRGKLGKRDITIVRDLVLMTSITPENSARAIKAGELVSA